MWVLFGIISGVACYKFRSELSIMAKNFCIDIEEKINGKIIKDNKDENK